MREGEGGQSGSKGGCKKVPIWRVPIYESNESFVCSWLFFTVPVQRISQGVVHQEFNDIDSDSGTYSDANGIKKLPLLPRQLVKQGGSVKLWRVPLFWLACAHNLLLNVKFSPFCFARVFFKIFNHSCSCSSCIRRNFCGGAGDCGEHGRVGLT